MNATGVRLAIVALLTAACLTASRPLHGADAAGRLETLKEVSRQLHGCWRPPALSEGHRGLEITVLVSFRRDGTILGQPRITFETPGATDDDRIIYRTAVMKTPLRCTPLRFTDALAGAIAGHPLALRFDDRRRNILQPKERDAWLTRKIL